LKPWRAGAVEAKSDSGFDFMEALAQAGK